MFSVHWLCFFFRYVKLIWLLLMMLSLFIYVVRLTKQQRMYGFVCTATITATATTCADAAVDTSPSQCSAMMSIWSHHLHTARIEVFIRAFLFVIVIYYDLNCDVHLCSDWLDFFFMGRLIFCRMEPPTTETSFSSNASTVRMSVRMDGLCVNIIMEIWLVSVAVVLFATEILSKMFCNFFIIFNNIIQ